MHSESTAVSGDLAESILTYDQSEDDLKQTKLLSSQEDAQLQVSYAKIRRREMNSQLTSPQMPDAATIPLTAADQAQKIVQEWLNMTTDQKLKFKEYLSDIEFRKRAIYGDKKRQPREGIKVCNASLADRRHYKWYLKSGKPFSVKTDVAYVKTVQEFVPGQPLWQPEKGTKEAEKQHFKMTPNQICAQIDKIEALQKFHKSQKKNEPYSKYLAEMIQKLCFEQRIDCNEAMELIADSWKKMSVDERQKYESSANVQLPKTKPQQIRIKHTFEGSGLKLDGYVYYAQKMRQTEFKDKKVKNILEEIKKGWEALSEVQKQDYEKKAEYVSQQMKCRKYQAESLLNKKYL